VARIIKKTRELNNKILIVCGGQTEILYFNNFKSELAKIKIIPKLDDRNPKSIVQTAIDMKNQSTYKMVWCVFDKDDFTCFDEAIDLADKNLIRCAYSNQAFELWYILHFKQINGKLSRTKYGKFLSDYIKKEYSKTDPNNYKYFKSKMPQAITNAKVGHQIKIRDGELASQWESCTTVYELVETLLEWKK
jgi:hypothetical protein